MTETSNGKSKEPASAVGRTTQKPSLIFISHDSRDAELAEAFSKLLSNVSGGVLKSFYSTGKKPSQGIEYGAEWFPEIMQKLDEATDVVCLLTQRSLERPWILYEAGVAKGKLDTKAFGVALGIPLSTVVATGPFSQFQNCGDDVESLTALVMQLVRGIPNADPDHDAVELQVRAFKEKVDPILKRTGSGKDAKKDKLSVEEISVAKLFEEIKLMFQDLPTRIEGKLAEATEPSRRRKFRRFHPMMLAEMLHMTKAPEIDLLIVGSLFRDEMPWLYEMCVEASRAIKSGDLDDMERARSALHRIMEFTERGPLGELFEIDSKEGYFIVRELHRIIDRYLIEASKRKHVQRPKKQGHSESNPTG